MITPPVTINWGILKETERERKRKKEREEGRILKNSKLKTVKYVK